MTDPFHSFARGTFPADSGLLIDSGDPGPIGPRRVLVTPGGGLYVRDAANAAWITIIPASDGPGGGGGGGDVVTVVQTYAGGPTVAMVNLGAATPVPSGHYPQLGLDSVALDLGGDYLTPDPDNDQILVDGLGVYHVSMSCVYNPGNGDAGTEVQLDTYPSQWSTLRSWWTVPTYADPGGQLRLNVSGTFYVNDPETLPVAVGVSVYNGGAAAATAGGAYLAITRIGYAPPVDPE